MCQSLITNSNFLLWNTAVYEPRQPRHFMFVTNYVKVQYGKQHRLFMKGQ